MVLLNLMENSSFSIETSLHVLEDLKMLDSQHHLPTRESVMVREAVGSRPYGPNTGFTLLKTSLLAT